MVLTLRLFYRNDGSGLYMMGKLIPLSDDYYSYTIPAEFINSKYIMLKSARALLPFVLDISQAMKR